MTATRTTYWAKFGSYLEGLDSPLRVGRYLPANRTHAVEIKHPAGFERDGAHLAATALDRESVIRANVVLEDDDSLTLFEALRTMGDALDVGGTLKFEGARNPRARATRGCAASTWSSPPRTAARVTGGDSSSGCESGWSGYMLCSARSCVEVPSRHRAPNSPRGTPRQSPRRSR